MTTGIGDEFDPGDSKESHEELKVEDLGVEPNVQFTTVDAAGNKYYTRRQIADMLSIDHSTISRWELKSWIPRPTMMFGRAVVYSEQEFQTIKQLWEQSYRNIRPAELCFSCKRRKARAGSTLCSRCTYEKVETSLRSTLPGMVKDEIPPASNVTSTLLSVEQSEEVIECPNCHSTDPEERRMVTTGDPDFPISLQCEHEWHNQEVQQQYSPLPAGVKYYSRAELASLVGVSPTTLYRWQIKGVIPPPFQVAHSKQIFYTDEHLQKAKEYSTLVEQQRISPVVKVGRQVAPRSFSKMTERAVAIRLPGFKRGGLI